MSLAENVKYHQELKNLTTQEFAAKANLPADTINKIRAGSTQNPSMDTLKRMATALDCSIDELAGMPEQEADVRDLLPKDIPKDPEAIVDMLCKTLKRQTISHEKAMYEVRRDRNWWRGAALAVMGCVIVTLVVIIVMVALLYWDLSHPTEGNILYSFIQHNAVG